MRSRAPIRTNRPSPIPPQTTPPEGDALKYNDRRLQGDRVPVRAGTCDEGVRLAQRAADRFDRILRPIGVAWAPAGDQGRMKSRMLRPMVRLRRQEDHLARLVLLTPRRKCKRDLLTITRSSGTGGFRSVPVVG